jgi:hypothetical protein
MFCAQAKQINHFQAQFFCFTWMLKDQKLQRSGQNKANFNDTGIFSFFRNEIRLRE